MILKSKRHKSKKILESAKGQSCTVRLPGICNFNEETTIPAHLGGGGMGTKRDDLFIAYCCSSCHWVIDGHGQSSFTAEELAIYQYEAVFETQKILLDAGLIKI